MTSILSAPGGPWPLAPFAELAWAPGALWALVATAPLARSDLRERILPDRWTLSGLAVALAGWALMAGPGPSPGAVLALLAVALGALALCARGGLGMGDAKLAAFLAAVLCARDPAALPIFLGASALAGAALVRGPRSAPGGESRIPFGPPLLLGFWLAMLVLPVPRP